MLILFPNPKGINIIQAYLKLEYSSIGIKLIKSLSKGKTPLNSNLRTHSDVPMGRMYVTTEK